MRARTILLVCGALAAAAPASAEAPSARQVQVAASHCGSGRAALAARDAAKAEQHFRKALAACPGFPDAHLGLGHVAALQGRHEAALGEYRAARDAWRTFGAALQEYRLARWREAQEGIAVRQEQDVVSPEGYGSQTLAGMPHASGAAKGARLEAEVAALRAAERPLNEPVGEPPVELWFFEGAALYRLGRVEEAAASWEVVATRAPGFGPVHNNLAEAMLRLGRREEARRHLARAEELGVAVNPELKARIVQ